VVQARAGRRGPAGDRPAGRLLARAEGAGDTYLPGYTHVQRAQPVLLAHHLLAHGWAFARDVDRLVATVRAARRVAARGRRPRRDVAADRPCRHATALGFADVFANSLDAVSDRDFVAEALFDLALVGVHLARLARSGCCGRARSSGSPGSTTPTPPVVDDAAEEERRHRRAGAGKAGRLIGNLTGLLAR
jgi:argininosuccinate lyase